MKYSHIIWDFNGTILNDLHPCFLTVNTMLSRRSLPPIESIEKYREVFGFPIQQYYEQIGFDFQKESYAELAIEWAELYVENSKNSPLCEGVREALDFFNAKGIPQVILSATETNMLMSQLQPFNIKRYFHEIMALSNLHAVSKIQLAFDWAREVKPEKALVIGDTIHDFETAQAIGADCILIANGHQSRERLEQCGVRVADSAREIKER